MILFGVVILAGAITVSILFRHGSFEPIYLFLALLEIIFLFPGPKR